MFEGRKSRSRLEKLIRQWTEYKSLVLNRLGAEGVGAAEEQRFLKLKGQVAEGLVGLTMELAPSAAQEAQVHLRAVSDLLNRYPTLFAAQPLSQESKENFERNWHDHYLFLNKMKAVQSHPQAKSAKDIPHPMGPGMGPAGVHKRSGGARFGVVFLRLLVLVALGWALVRFIPWHRLGSGENAGGFGGFAKEAWASTRETFSHFSIPSLGGVLDPAIDRYGPELTTVLVAVFFIALGYWVFIRMR